MVLLSVTVMENAVSAVAEALSVTRMVTGIVAGPSFSPGVQLNTPVDGLTLAPEGAVTRLKVSA